jgi:hypothetical protein
MNRNLDIVSPHHLDDDIMQSFRVKNIKYPRLWCRIYHMSVHPAVVINVAYTKHGAQSYNATVFDKE